MDPTKPATTQVPLKTFAGADFTAQGGSGGHGGDGGSGGNGARGIGDEMPPGTLLVATAALEVMVELVVVAVMEQMEVTRAMSKF